MTLHHVSLALFKKRRNKVRNSFTFVFLGDSRGVSPTDPINVPVLKGALACAAKFKPLFILHGGDLAYWGTKANLERFKGLVCPFMRNYKIPLFAIPGNHEVYQSKTGNDRNLTNFKRVIGPVRYTIDVPTLQFRLLAENNVTSLPFKQGDVQLGFNRNDLNLLKEQTGSRDFRNQIVAMHGPIATPKWAYHSMGKIQTQKFLNVINGKNEVRTVLVSHIHAFDKTIVKGVKYVLSGGAGAPLEKEQFPNARFHIVVFRVTKNSISHPLYVPLKKSDGRWGC